MIVSNFKKITKVINRSVIFSADFIFESRPDLNKNIWFKVPVKCAPKIFPYEAFLCAAYPLGLRLNEDLKFDASVSKKLLANLDKIGNYIGCLKKIKVDVRVNKDRNGFKKSNSGLFFTLGVDSFYSLFRLGSKINTLIFIDGFDIKNENRNILKNIHKRIEHISKLMRINIMILSTNLRWDLSEKFMPWTLYHGAALASMAYLSRNLSKVYISSSDQYFSGILWGTGKVLDSLWSSDFLSFVSFAADKTREDKIKFLIKNKNYWNVLSENLRVCWRHFGNNNIYNCLSCEKCLRTFLQFKLMGFTDEIKVFKEINLKEIKNLVLEKDLLFTWKMIYKKILENEEYKYLAPTIKSIIE